MVESIAWAAERKNVLSMMFFLLALHAYDRYARRGATSLYVLVTVFFILGLLAKPQIITLPFVLLLWDHWPLQRMGTKSAADRIYCRKIFRAARTSLSTFIPISVYWKNRRCLCLPRPMPVVTMISQRAGNSVRSLSEIPLTLRVENVFVS